MDRSEMDCLGLDNLRRRILENPNRRDNWYQLARELTLIGYESGVNLSPQIADIAPGSPQEFHPRDQAFVDKQLFDGNPGDQPRQNHVPVSEPLDFVLPEEPSLEAISFQAARLLKERNQPWLVISVAAGTITIAARQSSAKNAALYLSSGQTHVQTSERLVYRDPESGVRVACLTMQPIRLADLQPRRLEEYELEYAGSRCPLYELMPTLKVPLRVQLEGWDGMRIRGWMGFSGEDLIPRIPAVVAVVDETPVMLLQPRNFRLDVTQALQKQQDLPTGFQINGLRKLIRRDSSQFQLRDPLTFELYGAFILNRFRTFHQQIQQVSKGFCGCDFQARDGEVVVTSLPRHRDHQPVAVALTTKLDILVPVYKDWSLTRRCLEALTVAVSLALETGKQREIHVHCTNDCSPDVLVNDNLPELCVKLGIIYHSNRENLGFIRTVNNFMNATSGDVLLVNSDVIVSRHCIDELVSAREALGAHVASLTAFSNNATIFSYPRQICENSVSSPAAIERIADAFRAAGGSGVAPATHQVPVSHGFLMYLTRTALRAVGVFDEYFGKGYGEEVDWAMRAALKGFEHHICTKAFAFHKGSVSFGEAVRLKVVSSSNKIIGQRYPFYDKMIEEFIYTDEFLPLRNRVGMALIRDCGNPLIIHVTHSSGGGIDTYIQGLQHQQAEAVHVMLRPGRSHEDLVTGQAATKFFAFSLECLERDAVILGDFRNVIRSSLESLSGLISSIVLHSFVGWKADEIELLMAFIRQGEIPYTMIGHDYMTLCPRIKLIDSTGSFCDVGDTARCTHCLRTGSPPVESSLLAPYPSDISLYRNFFSRILCDATEIICSTPDQAERFTRQGLKQVVVREPYEPLSSPLPSYRHDPNSRNIVLIGGVSVEKGADRLFQVASHSLHINSAIHFYLVGAASNIDRLASLPNFTHVGRYRTFNELHDLLTAIYSPIAFFPAIWPETWCYTLSEALVMGLPVIAPKLGALGTRLLNTDSPLVRLYSPGLTDYEVAELVCSGITTPS